MKETSELASKAASTPSETAGTAMRPIINTIARLIATDRRPSILASESGKILLANAAAQRLHLDQQGIHDALDWPALCTQAQRAGSTAASLSLGSTELEGEVVHVSLCVGEGYLLRLSENDHEATWLRNRARAATLMRVAHDLRTPIQSLLATADNVLNEDDRKTAADKAAARQELHHSAELALDHISNILGVIRGEQSVTGLQPDETFNITEELRTLLTMIAPIARKQNVDLKLWLDPHDDIWVHGPVRFVRAVFQNMIDNSVKYGGGAVEIGLSCHPLPSPTDETDRLMITLTVSDLGGGLPPEQKARLVEALGQTEARQPATTAATANARPSAGMNVLAHALRQLGGKIHVSDRYAVSDSTQDTEHRPVIGTTMHATVTLQKSEQPNRLQTPATLQPLSDAPLAGISVILVEDSPSSRDWIRHVLESAGAQVWATGNGVEALSLLERPEITQTLDLILTDMTLPYMSGIEFAQRVRQQGQTHWNGPIVALTAHVADSILNACSKVGIAQVLEKPIQPAELRNALRRILSTRSDSDAPQRTAPETAPAPQDESQTTDGPLKARIVEDLLSQLGRAGAISFMQRAHSEAVSVLSNLQQEGVGPDTGRMLHAATGACSLTGLGELESCLRAMECAFDGGAPLSPCEERLKVALTRTKDAIDALN
jgi:CheY-like chemotaxis protein